jgi:Zn-dependent M32 family carboxypeptidase
VIKMYSQATNSPILKNLRQVKQEKYMKKKKLNINLVHYLWLDLDQGRIDQVVHPSIGYLWKQLDHKNKVFKE